MPHVQCTGHLRRFFPDLGDESVEGYTVAEVISALDRLHPGIAAYIVDERGALRTHVNIFVANELIRDRIHLTDPVDSDDRVFILQALSGG
jgi:hypothetical protein